MSSFFAATIVTPSIDEATDVHDPSIPAGVGDHWY
jgi:hypothetical protein